MLRTVVVLVSLLGGRLMTPAALVQKKQLTNPVRRGGGRERWEPRPRTDGNKMGPNDRYRRPTTTKEKVEWLEDDEADRTKLHVLLLQKTFDKPRISVKYVSGALQTILGMSEEDAVEHAAFAAKHGMCTLGLWEQKESLEIAVELQQRDLAVRCVPVVKGKADWQSPSANRFYDLAADLPSFEA